MRGKTAPKGLDFETVRVGGFRAVVDLLEELGHDPEPCLTASGLTLDMLRDPEGVVQLSSVLRLFLAAARATRLPHFGLLRAPATACRRSGSSDIWR